MRTTKNKIYGLIILVALFIMSMSLAFAGINKKAEATNEKGSYFQMVTGASIKIRSNGIRFSVDMDEDYYHYIVDNENKTIKFILAPYKFLSSVENGEYISLYNADSRYSKCILIDVDEDTIVQENDLYRVSAGLTNLKAKNMEKMTFFAVACIYDTESESVEEYASFENGNINNVVRSQYQVLTSAILDTTRAYYKDLRIKIAYDWFGTEDYPIVLDSQQKYNNFITIVSRGETFSGVNFEITANVDTAVEIPDNFDGAVESDTYTITLNAGGGTNGSATVVKNATAISINSLPIKVGYAINGYKVGGVSVADKDGNLIANVDGYTDENAQWVAEENTTFDVDWVNYVIYDRTSAYDIVVASNATDLEQTAAYALQDWVEQSTLCELNILNAKANSRKFISIGNTAELSSSGFSASFSETNFDGYKIKTDNDGNIYIFANTDVGVLNGVYGYLTANFGLDLPNETIDEIVNYKYSSTDTAQAIAYSNADHIVLNDLSLNLTGTVISSLASELDLNGHTLTIDYITDAWDETTSFISGITSAGSFINGKVEFNLTLNKAYRVQTGRFINTNNGLVKDIEVEATFSGTNPGQLTGLFNSDATGTYENVVVDATGTGSKKFGIFKYYNEAGELGDITLTNCVFIGNGVKFASYGGGTPATLNSIENKTNSVYFTSFVDYYKANYNASSFDTDIWTINDVIGIPFIEDKDVGIALIDDASDFTSVSNDEDTYYILTDDVTINVSVKNAVVVGALKTTLDLNGHTVTMNVSVTDAWDIDTCFINEITSAGKLINGNITFNYSISTNLANLPAGLIVNKNNGLVKDLDITATYSGSTNMAVGLFHTADATGTFENVDVTATGTGNTMFGIFRHYNDNGELGGITVNGCTFVGIGVRFASYWSGNTPATISSVTSTNSTYNYIGVINSVAQLNAISGVTDTNYRLMTDLTINLNETGTVISSLETELDLNGHTLTISFTAGEWDDPTAFIKEITSTGKLINGKIIFSHTLNTAYRFQIGRLVYMNNGLVKDVEVVATFSGSPSMATGLFNSNVSGKFENVVVKATGTGTTYFGIFHNDETLGRFGDAIVKNCIFIGNSCELAGRWSDQAQTTIASVTNNDNSCYYSSTATYTSSGYDVSSFNTDIWAIDGTTHLPSIK